jgi:TusA-related sulfurtransferase
MDHALLLDMRGRCCAEPIIRLSAAIKSMQPGSVLLAESDRDAQGYSGILRADAP